MSLGYSRDGINFIFGGLAGDSIGFVFAINVLPVIVFFLFTDCRPLSHWHHVLDHSDHRRLFADGVKNVAT